MKRKTIMTLLLAAAAASSALIAVPETAQAATVPCDEGFGGAWCIWQGTGATGNSFITAQSIPDLGLYGYRNADESIENNGWLNNVYLRLYYSTNYHGAWACMNPVSYISNTSHYAFNQGSGLAGYGQSIWKNVASASWSTTPCSHPIA